jgi:hypothetical protein
MTAKQPWFTVDRAGLAKIVADRGKGAVIAIGPVEIGVAKT